MTGNIQPFVHKFFNADSLEKVSLNELKKASTDYPYFGLSHFLLSKKMMQAEGRDSFSSEEAKLTALYFQNPFWLEWLLTNSFEGPSDKKPDALSAILSSGSQPANRGLDTGQHLAGLGELNKTGSHADDQLLFQPYHTVDYFASQGISFIEEEAPKDKLGLQLKSFTEWLKTLKKMPQKIAAETEETEWPGNQFRIDLMAQQSAEKKEVVTETMADVLSKQGKNLDAIEIYQKLSLLNPHKIAYFAAKIDQLK
jgi:hypothetical protein